MNQDRLEELEQKIEYNLSKINDNYGKIQQNTGALEILKTFKADSNKFFIMWVITFIALLCSLCFVMFLLHR